MGATANSVAAAKSVTIGSGSLPVMAPSSDATVHPTGSPALTKATQTGTVERLKHGGPQEAQSAEASGRYGVRPVGAHTIKKKKGTQCRGGKRGIQSVQILTAAAAGVDRPHHVACNAQASGGRRVKSSS